MLENSSQEMIQPCNVDVRLGRIYRLKATGIVDFDDNLPEAEPVELPYILQPGEYVLGATVEKMDQKHTKYGVLATARSRAYRLGLSIQCGLFHPYTKGEMVFGIKNISNYPIRLKKGMSVMTLGFFDIKSDCVPLKHRYHEGKII